MAINVIHIFENVNNYFAERGLGIMKQRLLALFLCFALVFGIAEFSYAAAGGYGATALTGGTSGCLDAINGATLVNGDKAIVNTTTSTYFYNLNSTSAASESSPDIIAPDTNAGDKRWLLLYAISVPKGIDQARYAADAQANDTYVVTLSPVPAAYYAGMAVNFMANTANTGACTLNVNSLGAKTIKKRNDQTLANGDIEANQFVTVIYDGTNFQMQSQVGATTGTGSVVHSAAPTFTGQPAIPTINLTGGQIAFPSTAAPSAGVNTLDDYEEGYFDMTVVCETSGSYTVDGGANACAYTKIGRIVHVQGSVNITGETSPVGELRFLLPFTSSTLTDSAHIVVGNVELNSHGGDLPNGVHAYVTSAKAYFRLNNIADNGISQTLDKDDVDTAWTMRFGFSYLTQ